jgi:hypothetical protein
MIEALNKIDALPLEQRRILQAGPRSARARRASSRSRR